MTSDKGAKRVLFISYYYPPTGGAAVQRPAKFVKYMGRFGFQPTVLTVENPSVPIRDESMLNDGPQGITVLRARTLEPPYEVKKSVMSGRRYRHGLEVIARSILIPDPQTLWIPFLMKKILSVRKNPPDLIFVTAPPFSSLVAGVLAKLILRRPLISDFRDEWVGWLDGSSWKDLGTNKNVRAWLERMLERLVVRHSDAVVSASPGYVGAFREKYPGAPADKFCAITNGYDPDDFESAETGEDLTTVFRADRLNLLYMGTVFPLTSLKYFLGAINALEAKEMFNLVIAGRITGDEDRVLESYTGFSIRKLGYVPHAAVVQLARHSDALLLTLSPLRGAERVVPGKIFEYLALRKRIIAIMPKGSASHILEGLSGCVTVDPLDAASIARACQSLLEEWRSCGLAQPVANDPSEHSRERKTELLCALFNGILDKSAVIA